MVKLTVALLALSMVFCAGCELLKPSCQAIKVANTTCTVLEVVGADGGVERVSVTRDDLMGLAHTASARRSIRDGGTN